jgi:hypothetical protein
MAKEFKFEIVDASLPAHVQQTKIRRIVANRIKLQKFRSTGPRPIFTQTTPQLKWQAPIEMQQVE